MKYSASRFFVLFVLCGASLFADDLQWGGTWSGVWASFGTSPYTAIDTTQNKVLTIFCLDFNDEIAPPITWQANIHHLTPSNVTDYAQFGGNYGHGITTAPWAFTADGGVNPGHAVDLTLNSSSAYTRYMEAAWLFTNILAAQTHGDMNTMIISQVAAWELFVETQNAGALSNDIAGNAVAGANYTFNNFEYSTNHYADAPTTESITSLMFEDAVNEALNAAQNAVLDGWYTSGYAPGWDVVTGDPDWTTAYGRPVQEFLTPGVPEPASIFLFGTVVLAAVRAIRRKDPARLSRNSL